MPGSTKGIGDTRDSLQERPYQIPSWHCTRPLHPGWHQSLGNPSLSLCRPMGKEGRKYKRK